MTVEVAIPDETFEAMLKAGQAALKAHNMPEQDLEDDVQCTINGFCSAALDALGTRSEEASTNDCWLTPGRGFECSLTGLDNTTFAIKVETRES